ncbi:MFS transporter [Pseudomonas sp. NPDC007930]|uniref:MFS transporter n=1 Tax=Pseudomonas sp. NPDC007930 TaxID=3364417 RepID=UPI0036ED6D0C
MTGRLPKAALAALILATVIAVYDLSMVNLALPVIAADLGVPAADALWLSRANLLACALCILPFSALGGRVGHRYMLACGLALVAATSIACALITSLPWMVALRAVQGAASAAVMCSTLVLTTVITPQERLGSAMGINALFVALTSTVSPALTGLLLHWLSWRWLFGACAVLALPALCMAVALLPRIRGVPRRFDWLGSALLLALLALLLSSAWTALPPLAIWLGGALLSIAFLRSQRDRPWSLLPLNVLANLPLSTALCASSFAFVAQSAVYSLMPMMLQRVLGYSPLDTAWVFLAWPLLTALTAPLAGRWADHYSTHALAMLGMLVLGSGLWCLMLLPPTAAHWDITWRMGLCGIGFGLFQSPNNRGIMLSAPAPAAPRLAALICLARLAGQACGVVLASRVLAQSGSAIMALHIAIGIAIGLQVAGASLLVWGARATVAHTRLARH